MSNKPQTFRDSVYWKFLKIVPQNLISRVAGAFAGWRMPGPLMRWTIRRFASYFKINMQEIAHPIENFHSLQSFFIRELKAGVRPVSQARDDIVSPCDAAYGQSGTVEGGLLMQVKGKSFRLSELLSDDKWSTEFEGGSYAVLYLSPKDYHRFHAPCDLRVTQASHVPGRLWPVNLWAVRNVDELFCVNERIVMKVSQSSQNLDPFAIIAVGATMVGKVKVLFDNNLTTNVSNASFSRRSYVGQEAYFAKGDELGRFEFGSTIIMVVPKKFGALDSQAPGTPIKMGQKIGTITHASNSKT